MIRFACPHCSAVASAEEDQAGRVATCPTCKLAYTVPVPEKPKVTLTPVYVPPTTQPPPAPPRLSELENTDRTGRVENERSRKKKNDDTYGFDDDDDDSDTDRPRKKKRSNSGGGGLPRARGRVTLTRIDPASCMKIQGALCFTMGLIMALFYGCSFGMMGAAAGGDYGTGFFRMGALFIIFMPFIYGIAGAIGGIIFAFLYNMWAGMIGGLEMDFE